ncbi:NAD(P)H-binding protein (plasmid) [Klebsiella sp. WOUb02]|uniref:NAD(P)H-binding protein n=1 Tax=Klebsiella sp. WOUb02 TaxID=3161071 RepID=UPI003CF23706
MNTSYLSPWPIFGASSGVGLSLVQQGLEKSRTIHALVRSPEKSAMLRAMGVNVIEGDAVNAKQVEQACVSAGANARIISTLGSLQADYAGNRLVIDTAERCGMKYMLLVTSIGCNETWGTLSARALQSFGHAVREKSLAESWLRTSSLHWCIVRPGGLKHGGASGRSIRIEGEAHGLIYRSDVAQQICQLIDDEHAYGHTYALIDPTLKLLNKI